MSEKLTIPGNSKTVNCNNNGCHACFDILYEPSMEGANKAQLMQGGYPAKEIKCCPFCLSEDITIDE